MTPCEMLARRLAGKGSGGKGPCWVGARVWQDELADVVARCLQCCSLALVAFGCVAARWCATAQTCAYIASRLFTHYADRRARACVRT
eukprot:3141737-Alexandrium_andersonii.AAC.1